MPPRSQRGSGVKRLRRRDLRIGKAQSAPGCLRMRSCHNRPGDLTLLDGLPDDVVVRTAGQGPAGRVLYPPAVSGTAWTMRCAQPPGSAAGRSNGAATRPARRSPQTGQHQPEPPSTLCSRESERLRTAVSDPRGLTWRQVFDPYRGDDRRQEGRGHRALPFAGQPRAGSTSASAQSSARRLAGRCSRPSATSSSSPHPSFVNRPRVSSAPAGAPSWCIGLSTRCSSTTAWTPSPVHRGEFTERPRLSGRMVPAGDIGGFTSPSPGPHDPLAPPRWRSDRCGAAPRKLPWKEP